MNEVLACFDNIVVNVSNSTRLVEECTFLVRRIRKVAFGKVMLFRVQVVHVGFLAISPPPRLDNVARDRLAMVVGKCRANADEEHGLTR